MNFHHFFSCFPCFFDQVVRKKIRSTHRFLMVKACETMIFVGFSPIFVGFSPIFVGFSLIFVGFSPIFVGFSHVFPWFFTRCLPACRCSCRHRHPRGQRLHQWPWHLRPAALLPEKLETRGGLRFFYIPVGWF